MKAVIALGFVLMLLQVLMIHEIPMVYEGIVWGHITFPVSILIILIGFIFAYARKKKIK